MVPKDCRIWKVSSNRAQTLKCSCQAHAYMRQIPHCPKLKGKFTFSFGSCGSKLCHYMTTLTRLMFLIKLRYLYILLITWLQYVFHFMHICKDHFTANFVTLNFNTFAPFLGTISSNANLLTSSILCNMLDDTCTCVGPSIIRLKENSFTSRISPTTSNSPTPSLLSLSGSFSGSMSIVYR